MWCGNRANTHEHTIPGWIARHLEIKAFMVGEAVGGAVAPRHRVSFASLGKRIFCEPCDTHFKHLEDDVILLIVPMAKGQTLAIAPQRALRPRW